jgi:spore germination protein
LSARNRMAPVIAGILALVGASALAAEPQNPTATGTTGATFKEVWAYLLRGEEAQLSGTEPVTDICYFGASLGRDGRIRATISRPALVLKDGRKPAIHLVVNELSNESLMHFSLDPEYGVRPLLIQDICRVSAPFDGVQIDFESVARDDAEYFYGFLKDLKAALPPGKTLSVAVPARTRTISDAYDYSRIAAAADRIVIMAYDEHWSGSAPGPVASLAWCARVVDFAASVVPTQAIVMGLPLYGRAWQDKRLARALRFQGVQDLAARTGSTTTHDTDLGAWFEYSENVTVKVFFDDARTLMAKLQLYQSRKVTSVSFWRIGMGPSDLWSGIELAGAASSPPAAARTPVPSPTAIGGPGLAPPAWADGPSDTAPAQDDAAMPAPPGAGTPPSVESGLVDPLPQPGQSGPSN